MKRPTVFLDMDGVIVDLVTPWLAAYNRLYGDALRLEQITRWEIDEFTVARCGTKIFELLTPELYQVAAPVLGAWAGVCALRDAGLRVVFATATGAGMADAKRAWLERHGFLPVKKTGAPHRDLVCIADKALLAGGGVLLDDYAANLKGWGRHGLLFGAPWNADDPRPHFNWRTAPTAIIALAEEAPSQTGYHLVRGPRAALYGHPFDNDRRIAGMWHALFGWKVRPADVWQAMVCVKLSREHNVPAHDNRADIAGYADTGEMVVDHLEKKS